MLLARGGAWRGVPGKGELTCTAAPLWSGPHHASPRPGLSLSLSVWRPVASQSGLSGPWLDRVKTPVTQLNGSQWLNQRAFFATRTEWNSTPLPLPPSPCTAAATHKGPGGPDEARGEGTLSVPLHLSGVPLDSQFDDFVCNSVRYVPR